MPGTVVAAVQRLPLLSGESWKRLIRALVLLFKRSLENPQVAELFRFIFLGTIVETSRVIGVKMVSFVNSFFLVKASFKQGELSYEWVSAYLEQHKVWNKSRTFRVIARNGRNITNRDMALAGNEDGYPDPVYEPSVSEPELFWWRGRHWITISKDEKEGASTLTLQVWSRNRSVLDEFIKEAREQYKTSQTPPPRIDYDWSQSLIVAHFNQADFSYDWVLDYLQSENVMADANEFTVSTKQNDVGWNREDPNQLVRYVPSSNTKQRLCWRGNWMQVEFVIGYEDSNGRTSGGSINITLHSTDRTLLTTFIDAARVHYTQASISRVTVHLTDNYGSWARAVTKNRRAFSTLILPTGVKETLLADAKEFLASEEWYTFAGVPHRRGYLLYGEPGTGKSSTIHAIAGELGLEIYFISLAAPGIDDYTLGRLIRDTPSRCILLIEDIDCAFPSREEDEDEEPLLDSKGNPIPREPVPPRSQVTLAGLLNVLDSVASEEGRLTFATTNHIEALDPALIRPGRMDLKIQYGLATTEQLEQMFDRFYPYNAELADDAGPAIGCYYDSSVAPPLPRVRLSAEALLSLGTQFAAAVPPSRYSIAQLQGYLLSWKNDPQAALAGVGGWMERQQREKQEIEEMKKRRRREAAARREAEERLEREEERRAARGSGQASEDGEVVVDSKKKEEDSGQTSPGLGVQEIVTG
ncbi:p-loop containing nucleoside triphosphate hydrolase protein [Mycena indigotica]|uniref:p-loop containing nucleoside triphosphate hydrolase protein n=1 Tax=Mycena indigotica TaxID=2126181 RepID=A0A8H6W922_9AGAR|nr:p-loop containing nucleoside triphosphate hydrolase protein [Mycena indigotica]KAF7309272.1 p-loop containing nucleoside triphosphate hydrolase protein [Mycena indigotica]